MGSGGEQQWVLEESNNGQLLDAGRADSVTEPPENIRDLVFWGILCGVSANLPEYGAQRSESLLMVWYGVSLTGPSRPDGFDPQSDASKGS